MTGALVATVSVALAARPGEEDQAVASWPRVALVVPRAPSAFRADTHVAPLVEGLRLAERRYGARTEILVADDLDPKAANVARAVERVRSGGFDLVVIASMGLAQPFAPAADALPSTPFVVIDSPVDLPNATGILFDDRQAGYLAGYLSGLMQAADAPRLNRARVVSAIGGLRGVPAVDQLIEGFTAGARRAVPGVTVLTAYSGDFVDRSRCQAVANRHVAAGADIVFAAAGTCSFGALSAAALQGVWAIGVDGDRSYLGGHVLASKFKRSDQAVLAAVGALIEGTLPGGQRRSHSASTPTRWGLPGSVRACPSRSGGR